MVHPAPNGFIGNCGPAFRQQIFHIAEAQREAEIEPNCPLNKFRWEAVTGLADFAHPLANEWLQWSQARYQSDNAIPTPHSAMCLGRSDEREDNETVERLETRLDGQLEGTGHLLTRKPRNKSACPARIVGE